MTVAWIESHQELGRHPKARKAARALGVALPALVGHLHYLWWWAMDYAPDGSLARFEAADIAEAALWDGDAADFEAALASAGFLDDTPDGYAIHDWDTYGGKLAARRRAGAARQALWRDRHRGAGATVRDADVTASYAAREEERRQEERREDQRRDAPGAPGAAGAAGASDAAVPAAPSLAEHRGTTTQAPDAAQETTPARTATHATRPSRASPPSPALPIGPLWDACVQALGHQPQTRTESSGWAAQVRQLAEVGATPNEVGARVRRYCAKYGRERLTIFALVKHWGEFALEGSALHGDGQTGAALGAAERERDAQRRAAEARRTRAELEDLIAGVRAGQ